MKFWNRMAVCMLPSGSKISLNKPVIFKKITRPSKNKKEVLVSWFAGIKIFFKTGQIYRFIH